MTYLRPEMSMSLIAIAIQGSINKVVTALIRIDVESELSPMFVQTPASTKPLTNFKVSSGNARWPYASVVTTRPMQRPMNMTNMPRMPPGLESFNLTSQANMAGGMHPDGIPMQRGPVAKEIPGNGNDWIPSITKVETFLRMSRNYCRELKAVERGQLLKLPFTTTFDYLQMLQLIALSMKSLGPLGSFDMDVQTLETTTVADLKKVVEHGFVERLKEEERVLISCFLEILIENGIREVAKLSTVTNVGLIELIEVGSLGFMRKR
ncbi:hypothetical protein Syun_002277 [Stephania yunnanensis]|uniref:Uncharacterized protein n=1 Tax=Stephania yunnanensis TaxID=152371 RepID=A0AAP0Q717_9MAGN